MSKAPLSPDEIERYARHLVLPEIGGAGQQKLKAARVLVVGAGGLGAPVLLYLAAAGVGHLGLVDDDEVSLSNLQRQIIHTTRNVGKSKVDSAAECLTAINPHPVLELHNTRIDAHNASDLVSRYDIVVDGCDNFATRFLVADWCERLEKTLVTGAVSRFDGSITTLQPFLTGPDQVVAVAMTQDDWPIVAAHLGGPGVLLRVISRSPNEVGWIENAGRFPGNLDGPAVLR